MTSNRHGASTSAVEVLNISAHGIWLLVHDREYFLDYKAYPWFRDAKISDIAEVELSHQSHLRWPKLDVDLEIESLEYPERYPLVYR